MVFDRYAIDLNRLNSATKYPATAVFSTTLWPSTGP
jgi:hypothetical protein